MQNEVYKLKRNFNLVKSPKASLLVSCNATAGVMPETGKEFARSSEMTHEDYSRIKLIALAVTYRTHLTTLTMIIIADRIFSGGHIHVYIYLYLYW